MCCFKESNVGCVFSTVLPPLADRILLAALTSHALIVQMHKLTTNCFSSLKSNSIIGEGQLIEDTFAKVGVISEQKVNSRLLKPGKILQR